MTIASRASWISPFSLPGRLLRVPLALVPKNLVVRVKTGVNQGKLWVTGAGINGCWIGTYEEDHVAALQRLVRAGMVAYDVGANAGYYTLALSKLVGDSGHVYSFEPEARNAYNLQRHIQLNALRNVTLVQAAVSDKVGMAGFEGALETARISAGGAYQVPTISLDEFVAAGNPAPAFIKMDIEGAERSALEGSGAILARREAIWMLATHTEQLRDECRAVMAGYGYSFTGFDGQTRAGVEADFLALPRQS